MPDPENNKDKENEQPKEAVQLDALGNKVESDVPALDSDPEEEASVDSEAVNVGEKEEADTPPDLVPDLDEQPEAGVETVTDDKEADTPFDDDKTEQAINEIVAKEGDDSLALLDAAALTGSVKQPRKHGAFGRFIRSKWLRSILFLLLLAGIAAVMVVPKTRYLALNTAGVRSSSSVVVVDSTTQLPLKGVSVSLAGQQKDTDSDGTAKFSELKLGPTDLAIAQVGFEEIKRSIVIGWGSNPFDSFALKATGVQYVIEVQDYLSEKPVEGVEATDGSATAISDKNGKITLTLESAVVAQGGVTLSKAGYRSEQITLGEDPKKPTKAALVLARKAVFVTKQSGKYDVYKSDTDGKNRQVLLPGTGHENSNISLVVSPDGNRAALVSTRDNKRDSSGFLLSSIMLMNTENGEKVTIAEASQIQLIDWIGPRLIFQLASSDGSAGNRYTVVSYNYTDNTRLQLASANQLGAVTTAQGVVNYAVGADTANTSLQLGLFKIKPDGSGKQRVFEGDLTTVLRSTYGTFSLQTDEGTWYTYDIANGSKSQISSPSSLANRLYTDNADRSRSLWVSQGALMSYEIATGKDATVKSQGGLTYPVQWLSETAALYRVSSGSETADYVVSTLGGMSHKVADVAGSYGFAQAQ